MIINVNLFKSLQHQHKKIYLQMILKIVLSIILHHCKIFRQFDYFLEMQNLI